MTPARAIGQDAIEKGANHAHEVDLGRGRDKNQFECGITAGLAPANPMKHALILGVVGVILGLVGVVFTWNLGLGPRWYPIALVVLAIPQCWVGGKLYEARSGSR